MVGVAQQVELLVVVQAVAGSSPVAHPPEVPAIGVETIDLGREEDAQRIAAVVASEGADAIELCLAAGPTVCCFFAKRSGSCTDLAVALLAA